METPTKKPMISDNTSEGIDRISSLPDEVLHNILSSLFIFDEVQLSVLSKRWKYIWTTMPYLHFDIDLYYKERLEGCSNSRMTEKFKDFINWVLISQRETKLVSFLLCAATHGIFDKMVILRWIYAVTRRNVQQVVLEICLGEPFELPLCLATCESLQVLKLNLSEDILKLPNHLGFQHLKLLHLEYVELSDQHLTNRLFSRCHLLENLILHECSLGDITLLHIASTSLIYITFGSDYCAGMHYCNPDGYGDCEVKISCPNLKFFKYKASMPKDIIIENLFSIDDVCIIFTDTIRSLEDTGIFVHKIIKKVLSTSALKLCKASISGLYEATSKERISLLSFSKLKSLKLEVGVDEDFMQVMTSLLKNSPNLEVLKLWSDKNEGWTKNWQMHDTDESIVCLKSHLKSIRLTDFKGEENEIELLRFFLKNARVLVKLTIVWAHYAHKSEKASEEVLKFPRTSSHVVPTFLDAGLRFRNWYDRSPK